MPFGMAPRFRPNFFMLEGLAIQFMQSGTFPMQFLPYGLILKILSGSTFPKTELGYQITYKIEHNDLC